MNGDRYHHNRIHGTLHPKKGINREQELYYEESLARPHYTGTRSGLPGLQIKYATGTLIVDEFPESPQWGGKGVAIFQVSRW